MDAAVSLPKGRDSAEALETILKRNKFDGALVLADTVSGMEELPWVKGVIVGEASIGYEHSLVKAVRVETVKSALRCAERGLAVNLRLGDLDVALGFAKDYPRTVIEANLDEWMAWAKAIDQVATETEVCVSVSRMVIGVSADSLRPYVQHLLKAVGPSRLIYASAWPDGLPDWSWKQSLAVFTQAMGAQTIEDREMILGGNAARLYAVD